ncbi:MAG: HEPN domain-containing protein [Candidatus Nezhaarchaeales archaeon]
MINVEVARDPLLRAKRCLSEAGLALVDKDAPALIRRSQEALKFAVKALLRSLAIEYPRAHDVSDALLKHKDKLPASIREKTKELAALVSELASIRGPAFYGYEREGIPASKAFTTNYAEEIHVKVQSYVNIINTALKPLIESTLTIKAL